MKTTIMTILLVALIVPTIAMAQGAPGNHVCDNSCRQFRGQERQQMGHERMDGLRRGRGQHPGLLAMADKVGLTDEQIQKIKSMQTDFQMVKIDQRAELKKAQLTIKSLRGQEPVSKSDLFRAIDKLAELKAGMQKDAFEHHEAIKAVLNAEQLEKLKEFRKEHSKQASNGKPCVEGESKKMQPGHGKSGGEYGKPGAGHGL